MKPDAARWGPYAPTPAQLKEFFAQVEAGRITRDSLQEFLRHGAVAVRKVFRLVVNYDESVEILVARGKYNYANPNIIAENFPTSRKGTVETELHLVHLNRVVSTDEALRALDQMGFRPAEVKEILTLGAERPDLQREFPIVALGSRWQRPYGYASVACLYDDACGRFLNLYWIEYGWSEYFRFLAVRK